jgi:hypothetical protein
MLKERQRGHLGMTKRGGKCQSGNVALLFVTALAILQSGCGSGGAADKDGGGNGKELAIFVGTWIASAGTITLDCSGQVTSATVTGDDVWQAGTTSDLLQPADSSSSGCILLANVAGDVATGLPNQTCVLPMGATTVNLTIVTYTFVVGANGIIATENASGTGTVTSNGTTGTCTYAEMATYNKQ